MKSRVVLMLLASAIAVSAADAPAAKRKAKKPKAAKPAVARADGPFADIPSGHWAYEAVKRATQAGILQHLQVGRSPEEPSTRRWPWASP